MFRNELQTKLKAIFGFAKVTFDAPSDSFEQDTLFIEIENSLARATNGKSYARVTGNLTTFSQNNKLPYGFFNKRIGLSDASLTKDFFFFEMDRDVPTSPARLQNISERRCRFVYLYAAQYDPNQGTLTEVEFTEALNQREIDLGDGTLLDVGDGNILGA